MRRAARSSSTTRTITGRQLTRVSQRRTSSLRSAGGLLPRDRCRLRTPFPPGLPPIDTDGTGGPARSILMATDTPIRFPATKPRCSQTSSSVARAGEPDQTERIGVGASSTEISFPLISTPSGACDRTRRPARSRERIRASRRSRRSSHAHAADLRATVSRQARNAPGADGRRVHAGRGVKGAAVAAPFRTIGRGVTRSPALWQSRPARAVA
jgi:hypothetical protein